VLDEGVLLLGRKTWELFSRIWPGRDDPFSARMNAAPKLVATGTLAGTSAGRTPKPWTATSSTRSSASGGT